MCVIFCWEFTPEMEFLDINLTKDLSLFLYDIHRPFYWRVFKNTLFFYGFKKPYEKIREPRKLEPIHEYHLVEWKNEGRKPVSLRRLELMHGNLY
jgi:hypothetical protein